MRALPLWFAAWLAFALAFQPMAARSPVRSHAAGHCFDLQRVCLLFPHYFRVHPLLRFSSNTRSRSVALAFFVFS